MSNGTDRKWVHNAIKAMEDDACRTADTSLVPYRSSRDSKLSKQFEERGITLYLKDESGHPSRSLKHRLGRSLFLYALCNGKIPNADTKVFEASSGSTAISEAYYAELIGLNHFTAVIPKGTSPAKIKEIARWGGKVVEALPGEDIVDRARREAEQQGGYFMDQFTYAERATDWRGNNNIAETIFDQMQAGAHQIPSWIVCGAGTGGTSATLGRYARLRGYETRLCVVDPYQESIYFDTWSKARNRKHDPIYKEHKSSTIEGIGRREAAASFLPELIDSMISIPNDASIAAMQYLNDTGRYHHGPSTGTNFFGALLVMQRMMERGEQGAVVTLLCDSGTRYQDTFYDATHLQERRHGDGTNVFDSQAIEKYKEAIRSFVTKGIGMDCSLFDGKVIADFAFDTRDFIGDSI